MSDRMLIHKPTGVLYVYQDAFAQREDFEEVINVASRVVPEAEVKASRKTKDTPKVDDAALSVDAGRGLP